jgi:hypothetical protein
VVEDERLVANARAGSREAARELVLLHRPTVSSRLTRALAELREEGGESDACSA